MGHIAVCNHIPAALKAFLESRKVGNKGLFQRTFQEINKLRIFIIVIVVVVVVVVSIPSIFIIVVIVMSRTEAVANLSLGPG